MLKIAQETVFGDKESISVFSVSAHTAAEWNIWDSRVKILSDTSYESTVKLINEQEQILNDNSISRTWETTS